MASGTTTLNFGAFPGNVEAETDVSGQAGFVATSRVEAWVQPVATADHSADEHKIERIRVTAFYKVDGTLTVRGFDNAAPAWIVINKNGVQKQRLYGLYTSGWAWSNS